MRAPVRRATLVRALLSALMLQAFVAAARGCPVGEDRQEIWRNLWAEGLATYVSEVRRLTASYIPGISRPRLKMPRGSKRSFRRWCSLATAGCSG